MNRWEQGRSVIVRLLEDRRLERVAPSSDHATFLVASARRHLTSAHTIRETDPELGLAAAYDACRKALAAVLAVQGLRPTSKGGHVAVIDAVRAQLDPPLGADISRVGVLRRERNRSEYPNPDSLPPYSLRRLHHQRVLGRRTDGLRREGPGVLFAR